MNVPKTAHSPVGWKDIIDSVESEHDRIEGFILKRGEIRGIGDRKFQVRKFIAASLDHGLRIIDSDVNRRPVRQMASCASASNAKIEDGTSRPDERIEQQLFARSQIIQGRVVGSYLSRIVDFEIRFCTRAGHRFQPNAIWDAFCPLRPARRCRAA
jgi:hypothetical protein